MKILTIDCSRASSINEQLRRPVHRGARDCEIVAHKGGSGNRDFSCLVFTKENYTPNGGWLTLSSFREREGRRRSRGINRSMDLLLKATQWILPPRQSFCHCFTAQRTELWDEMSSPCSWNLAASHRNYTQRDHHHHPHWIPVARSVVVSANRAKVVVFFVTVVWENDKDYTDRLTDWRWWWKEHHGNASVHSECNCSLRWYSFLVLAAIDVGIPLLWNHQLSLPLSLSSGIYFWYTTVCPSFVCHRATFKIGSYLFAVQNFKF